MRNTRKSRQILRSKKRPRRTLRSGRGSRTNSNTSHQIPARVIEADSPSAVVYGGADMPLRRAFELCVAPRRGRAYQTSVPQADEFVALGIKGGAGRNVVAGGLISYGTSLIENYRQVGLYAGFASSRVKSPPTC